MEEEGTEKARRVWVGELWGHEAYDFTPWLAENLSVLGDELGLSLSNPRMEVRVGSYWLDILADENEAGTQVAIENQLKLSNHHHLGQLLTYTAGRDDTRIAIWVAPEFRHEHAQALDWLNRWTADEISFYGVKIEAIRRSADSDPEARFRKVVWPGGWNQDISRPVGDIPDDREEFFRLLASELRRKGFPDKRPYKRFGTGGPRYFRSEVNRGISYGASVWSDEKKVVARVLIETDHKDVNKQVFDALSDDRAGIESEVNTDAEAGWRWNRHNAHKYSAIGIVTDGSIHDGEEELQEAMRWIVGHMHKLKEVLDRRIERVLQEAQARAPGEM